MSSPTAPSASPGCAIPSSVRTARPAVQPAAAPNPTTNAATHLARITFALRHASLYFETVGHLGKGWHCTPPPLLLQQRRQMVTEPRRGVAGQRQQSHPVHV